MINNSVHWIYMNSPNTEGLTFSTPWEHSVGFVCGEPVWYQGWGQLMNVFIPILEKRVKNKECANCSCFFDETIKPYAGIHITGYLEFAEPKKTTGFFSSLFSIPKPEPKSYLKIFCHTGYSISPIMVEIKPEDKENNFLVYESPYILIGEGVCDTIAVYLDKAVKELSIHAKRECSIN
ncbi:hypothetical protein [Aliivibrio sifiae]|uniref:hypothetical protein n=1 Tax=Aliivibrio sifiae TaxID=566293 RepID=UPI003D0D6E4B